MLILNICIKNRQRAKKDSYKYYGDNVAIISIWSSDDAPVKFAPNINPKYIMKIMFDDIVSDDEYGIPISENDAQKIVSFVNRIISDNIETIWVHCDAGISRSAGVAAAIDICVNGNQNSFVFNNSKYSPNMRCYEFVKNAFCRNNRIQ